MEERNPLIRRVNDSVQMNRMRPGRMIQSESRRANLYVVIIIPTLVAIAAIAGMYMNK